MAKATNRGSDEDPYLVCPGCDNDPFQEGHTTCDASGVDAEFGDHVRCNTCWRLIRLEDLEVVDLGEGKSIHVAGEPCPRCRSTETLGPTSGEVRDGELVGDELGSCLTCFFPK